MAATLVRCSFFLPKPPRPIPSPEFVDMIPFQKEKLKIWLFQTSSGVHGCPRCCCKTNTEEDVHKFMSEEVPENKLSDFCCGFLKVISDDKGLLSNLVKTLLIANASMMILPLEALAETCQPDNSLFNMPLLFAIAMIGAAVGGLVARQRKGELARLNDQLRQINAALRRQAKIESYAPNLSYAPVGRIPETEVIVDPRKEELLTKLRTGKNYLRNQDPEKAFVEFKAALDLADSLGDHLEKKKACRGLGASLQRQGKYQEAIKYHSKVLQIAKQAAEDSGCTEAFGAIADCYTEIGDLERAGKYYDQYIARLETD